MATRTLSKSHRAAISAGLKRHHASKKRSKSSRRTASRRKTRSTASRKAQSQKMKAHARHVKKTNPKLWKKQRAAYFAGGGR